MEIQAGVTPEPQDVVAVNEDGERLRAEHAQAQAEARKACQFATLNSVLASMQPGVKPHRKPFSKMAARVGISEADFEEWAETVPEWDEAVIQKPSKDARVVRPHFVEEPRPSLLVGPDGRPIVHESARL